MASGRNPPRGRGRYAWRVTDFYRTAKGKTIRVTESDDGMLSVQVLREGAWRDAPIGMIGLRLSPGTRRLTAKEIATLPE